MNTQIKDLRTAVEFIRSQAQELEVVSTPVQAWCELAARYALKGGGVPVRHPTKAGPAMLFEQVMPSGRPAVVGMFGTRQRCASFIGTSHDLVAEKLIEASQNPISPIETTNAPVQEVVYKDNVDLTTLPIATMAPNDAGPYIALGLSMAKDPVTGGRNISVHRLCVQGPDTLTIWMVPGRHLESFYLSAKSLGKPLPIAIHIGLDPAVYMASCCPSPLVPLGFNELDIASKLRGRPIEISRCVSVDADCISHAEYVLEGEITLETVPESKTSLHSMPEFLGYNGKVHPGLPVVKIKAITHRFNPLYQTVIGPGYEQSNLLAFSMEAAILHFLRQNVSSNVISVYCSSAGGGYLLVFIQLKKESAQDDGLVRRAGLAVFGVFRMIKQIVLVDEDVDVYNEKDVWWAMTTRFQVDSDLISVSKVQGFPLDPSQSPEYSVNITTPGMTSKAIFDCTVPFRLKETFKRTVFAWPTEDRD